MEYKLVYDAVAAGYTDWWFPAVGLVPIVCMTAMLYTKRGQKGEARRIVLFVVAISLLMIGVLYSTWITLGPYWEMRTALRYGQYTVVEGVVENYSASDHSKERWQVTSNGVVFEYRYAQSGLTPGFRQTALHGGPIRPGLHVRIADVDGHIARLEVARQD